MKKIAVGLLVSLVVMGAGSPAVARPSDAVLLRLYNLGVDSGFTYTGNNETHTFGGHTVNLTTTAGSLQATFDNGTGNLTVTIDGTVIYSVDASYMSERTIVGAHVAHNGQAGAWDHVERLGYSYTRQRTPSYVQSDDTPLSSSVARLGEWVASGKLGYTVGDVHPFGELSYIRDTMMTTSRVSSRSGATPANDKDEVGLAFGLDYRLSDTVTAGAQVSHGFFREGENNTSIVLDFRAEW